MKPVERSELVDYQTYGERRDAERTRVMALKSPRRLHVGGVLTFLFENRDTIRYQVQEMMLAERIVKEAEILHELSTYNELLGGPGALGASLLIEIESPAERDQKLRAWLTLPKHLYLKLSDGTKIRPSYDERQVGEDRLSSVHYLKFDVQGQTPVAVGADHPQLNAETPLTDAQRAALKEDLAG